MSEPNVKELYDLYSSQFNDFYTNHVIADVLAPQTRWTITNPSDKKPIDFRHLMAGCNSRCTHQSPVRGAWSRDGQTLVTLDELRHTLPNAANHAYYLQPDDGVLILDIEKTCSEQDRKNLLSIGALYAERSMSGKGYHLVLPRPLNYDAYPHLTTMKVIKENSTWEILQDHWVTFTCDTAHEVSTQVDMIAWSKLWDYLGQKVKPSIPVTDLFDCDSERPDHPDYDRALKFLISMNQMFRKKPADYSNDMSRYEWARMSAIARHVIKLSNHTSEKFSQSQMAWLTFETATQVLEHRSKHDEIRSGVPLLLNTAIKIISYQTREQESN